MGPPIVLSSRWEGLPMVIMEGLAIGILEVFTKAPLPLSVRAVG